ncbi:hypothetical protein ACROYT_G006425 [Oculina patagonica]
MSIYTESIQRDSDVLLLYFQMKNACFWSTVALVAIVLCFETVKAGGRYYKLYEVGRRPIDGIYCGDRIMDAYFALCYSGKRKRSSTLMDKKEASKFLHSQTIRNKRSTAVLVKTSEVGQRAIHGFYCGHQIANVYVAVCTLGMKRKRSVLEGEREAKSFLRRFNRATSSTDIVQECCNEGCHIEEVLEYC